MTGVPQYATVDSRRVGAETPHRRNHSSSYCWSTDFERQMEEDLKEVRTTRIKPWRRTDGGRLTLGGVVVRALLVVLSAGVTHAPFGEFF